MLDAFKKFILRGNVIDLAVAVVIGVAFNAVIQSLVRNILMPIIGIIGGKPSFDDYFFTVNESAIRWGSFLTDVINFIIIAAAVFVAVKAFERLQDMRRTGQEDVTDEPLTVEGELLTEIRDLLRGQRPPGRAASPGTPVSPEG
jgi:large conductance mechanosensitive channel